MHNSILVLSYLLDHMPLTISLHSRIEAAPPDFFFFLQLRCMGDVVDLAYLWSSYVWLGMHACDIPSTPNMFCSCYSSLPLSSTSWSSSKQVDCNTNLFTHRWPCSYWILIVPFCSMMDDLRTASLCKAKDEDRWWLTNGHQQTTAKGWWWVTYRACLSKRATQFAGLSLHIYSWHL